jgi:hypothetical protein
MMLNSAIDRLCTSRDEDFVLLILLIIGGWASAITCILGLLANTFSIIVLTEKTMRRLSTNTYLIALAAVNFLWLALFSLFYAFRLTVVLPRIIWNTDDNFYNAYNQLFHR